SQLYTELGRLVDAGHITVVAEGPRGRKEYQITDDGREDLHHWIVAVTPNPARRSDMLLRVFFLDFVRRDEAVDFLTERATIAAGNRTQLAELAQVVDKSTGPLSVTGRIALEWGLRYSACQQEWAEWALEQFQRDRAPRATD
ncbi:MAG: PadR family transcriptional regulator, partial [Actinocatenispora sp.]